MRLTAKQKLEIALLERLHSEHGLTVLRVERLRDRFGTRFKAQRGKTLKTSTVVMARLAVPLNSGLGKMLLKEYKEPKSRRVSK